jgi:hypothetical protein
MGSAPLLIPRTLGILRSMISITAAFQQTRRHILREAHHRRHEACLAWRLLMLVRFPISFEQASPGLTGFAGYLPLPDIRAEPRAASWCGRRMVGLEPVRLAVWCTFNLPPPVSRAGFRGTVITNTQPLWLWTATPYCGRMSLPVTSFGRCSHII